MARRLSIDGSRLKAGDSRLSARPWRSAHADGGANTKSWFTSYIKDGYFGGVDSHRIGQESSVANIGSGRATTYMDTGHADVAIQGTHLNKTHVSANPCVRVVPDSWEHCLAQFPEVWFNPQTGAGLWVIWYIGAPSSKETVACVGPFQIQAPNTPRTTRMEAVGRRIRCYDENNTRVMEMCVPAHMEHSTLHGVTHDLPLPHKPTSKFSSTSNLTDDWENGNWSAASGVFPTSPEINEGQWFAVTGAGTVGGVSFGIGDTLMPLQPYGHSTVYAGNWLKYAAGTSVPGWITNVGYGHEASMMESSWSCTPITHFSDESPGVLGPELLQSINFDAATGWVAGADWTIDTVTDDSIPSRPSAIALRAPAASSFVSGALTQELLTPLEVGKRYRITFGTDTVDLRQSSMDFGSGSVTAEIYDGAATTGALGTLGSANGALTVEFVAAAAHTTLSFVVQSALSGGSHKVHLKLSYVSLREFTPS